MKKNICSPLSLFISHETLEFLLLVGVLFPG